jgi:hypothetical protein
MVPAIRPPRIQGNKRKNRLLCHRERKGGSQTLTRCSFQASAFWRANWSNVRGFRPVRLPTSLVTAAKCPPRTAGWSDQKHAVHSIQRRIERRRSVEIESDGRDAVAGYDSRHIACGGVDRIPLRRKRLYDLASQVSGGSCNQHGIDHDFAPFDRTRFVRSIL